jgi:predicted permease
MDSLPASSRPGPWIDAVLPGYFATMGIPITRGRGFTDADDANSMKVAVVNEAMARGLWGTDEPLGKCIQIDSRDAPCTSVVGVAANRRYHDIMRPEWTYFVPLTQNFELGIGALFVQGHGDAEQLAATVRRELMAGDPNIRYAVVQPLQDVIDPKLHHFRLGATMFSVFGLLALVVAALGLFAVLAFDISQRTHEIGVRTALGASRHGIVGMVMRQALGLTAAGLAIGLIIAVFASGKLEPVLYEVSPKDPLVFGGVALILLIVAAAAGIIPAWRAARVDPVKALRTE